MPREVKKAGDKRGAGSGGGGSSSLDLIKERGSEPLGEGERVLNLGVHAQKPDRSARPACYGFMKADNGPSYQEGTLTEVGQWARLANIARLNAEKDEQGRSKHAVKAGRAGAESLHAKKDEKGRSEQGVKNAKRLHAKKDEQGRSEQGVEAAKRLHAKKDEQGRSVQGVKGAERLRFKREFDGNPDYNTAGRLLDDMDV